MQEVRTTQLDHISPAYSQYWYTTNYFDIGRLEFHGDNDYASWVPPNETDRTVRAQFVLGKTILAGTGLNPKTGLPFAGCENVAALNTWRCRGFGAAVCTLRPCIRIYNASMTVGRLSESLVDAINLPDFVYPDNWYSSATIFSLINTECATETEIQLLAEQNSTIVGPRLSSNAGWCPLWMPEHLFTVNSWSYGCFLNGTAPQDISTPGSCFSDLSDNPFAAVNETVTRLLNELFARQCVYAMHTNSSRATLQQLQAVLSTAGNLGGSFQGWDFDRPVLNATTNPWFETGYSANENTIMAIGSIVGAHRDVSLGEMGLDNLTSSPNGSCLLLSLHRCDRDGAARWTFVERVHFGGLGFSRTKASASRKGWRIHVEHGSSGA